MTIKRTMLLLLLVLGAILIASEGWLFSQSYERNETTRKAVQGNLIVDKLLESAGLWAQERGVSNSALGATDPASAEILTKIKDLRASSDAAFQEAITSLEGTALFVEDEKKSKIEAGMANVASLRKDIDTALSSVKSARDKELGAKWMPGITGLILETQKLRIDLATQVLSLNPSLGKDTLVRHGVWLMTEYAGRERGVLAGIISADEPISPDQLQQLLSFRGKVEEGWNILVSVYFSEEEKKIYAEPIETARKSFFEDFEKVRKKVYADAKLGIGYSMSAKDWIESSTQAISTLNNIQNVSSSFTREQLDAQSAAANSSMVLYAAALIVSVLTVFAALYVVIKRVLRPISQLSGSMGIISAGNFDQGVPCINRKDEIGNMAKSVEVFRQNGLEKVRLEQQAKEAELQAEAEKRAMMSKLASDFDKNIGGLISSLVSASTELQSTASSMRDIAEKTSSASQSVAASAEEASVNVNTVASAMEEMSSSSNEIAQQINRARTKSNDTAQNANQANETVSNLNKLVQNIGEVVTAIQDIAEQTNLLALNATIEAARAGEAGKGFAVVADEVKKLATETAIKTGEINSRINQIQAATKESVLAMQRIISNISEIDHSVTGVSAAVEEQNATTAEITRSVGEASYGTQHVSQIILDVQNGASETGASADAVLEAAQEVGKLSDGLKNSVDAFLDQIR